jgi:hypothetical protein
MVRLVKGERKIFIKTDMHMNIFKKLSEKPIYLFEKKDAADSCKVRRASCINSRFVERESGTDRWIY